MESTSNFIADYMESLSVEWLKNQKIREGDFFKGEILYCGKCGEPRRKWRDFAGKSLLTTEMCRCDLEKKEERDRTEKEECRRKKIEALKRESLMDHKFLNSTFDSFEVTEHSDKPKRIAMRYCSKFDEMLKKNQGLLFWGAVGTGKTTLAACIANHLMDNLNSVVMTSFVKIMQRAITSNEEDEEFIRKILRSSLLIIDDLGAERGTDYALEKVYNIVDSRYVCGKPVVYTTNLSLDEMKMTVDKRYSRIYDRIFENCYPVEFKGNSWRKREAAKRYEEMKSILED